MIDYLSVNNSILILIDLFGVWLAFWVYSADRKKEENRRFFLMVVAIISWISFYHLAVLSLDRVLSLTLFKLAGCSVFLFFIAYYFFVIKSFLNKDGIYDFLGKIIFLYGFIFSLISIFTNFIIKTSQFEDWGAFPVFPFAGGFIFYGYVIFLTVLINWTLLSNYFKSPPERKVKIQYFLMGMFIFAGLNFIFNVILPIFFENYKFYQIGNYSAFFLLCFTAYAIVKQKLFDIKIVLATIFVGLFIVLYIFDIVLFTPKFILQTLILRGGILVAFLSFGILLIRSVIKEVRAREEIGKLAEKLQLANKQQENLIHFINHQVKGFFTKSKYIYSGILEGDYGILNEKMESIVREGLRSDNEGVAMVEDILNASNIKSGVMKYSKSEIDFKDIVSSVVSEQEKIARDKGLSLEANIQEENYKISGDDFQLKQVVKNLIDNSIKYTPAGKVIISLSKTDGKILFSVKDTGIGFTKEDKQKLFTEGGKGINSQKVNVDSTGFGLFIAKNIVEAHNGKIWAESEGEGKGSEFRVELPLR